MKSLSLIMICATLFGVAGLANAQLDTLRYDGMNRFYLLHLPPSYNDVDPLPLVVALHGLGMPATSLQIVSKLSDKADAENFIVVYPQAVDVNRWWDIHRLQHDDAGYIAALLDSLELQYKIDSNRIYATGFSAGAIFSYYLAHKMADRIAAIAPVAYSIAFPALQPARAVPVVHFHAKNDNYFPVRPNMQYWSDINGCIAKSDTFMATNVTGERWAPLSNGAEVVLYTRHTGGHSWPTNDINATDVLWEFFKQHSLDNAPALAPKPQTPDSNLVVGKKAYVSSLEPNQVLDAANAVDGFYSTRWASDFVDPGWLVVKFDAVTTVGGVKIYWEPAYGRDYEIQVSMDSVNWTTVYTQVKSNGGIDTLKFAQIDAQYVRFWGTKRATGYGYSMYEFEVYKSLGDVTTKVAVEPVQPAGYNLAQNYPNPFNPVTVIGYSVPQRSQVTLKVFDLLGREVSLLVNKEVEAGAHSVRFDASHLAAGVYFYQIQTGAFSQTNKFILLK